MERLTGLLSDCEAHKSSLLQHGMLSSAFQSFFFLSFPVWCLHTISLPLCVQGPCIVLFFSPYVLAPQLSSSLSQFLCGLRNNPVSPDCILNLPKNEGKRPLSAAVESLCLHRDSYRPWCSSALLANGNVVNLESKTFRPVCLNYRNSLWRYSSFRKKTQFFREDDYTQLGSSSCWSFFVIKDDKQTHRLLPSCRLSREKCPRPKTRLLLWPIYEAKDAQINI